MTQRECTYTEKKQLFTAEQVTLIHVHVHACTPICTLTFQSNSIGEAARVQMGSQPISAATAGMEAEGSQPISAAIHPR